MTKFHLQLVGGHISSLLETIPDDMSELITNFTWRFSGFANSTQDLINVLLDEMSMSADSGYGEHIAALRACKSICIDIDDIFVNVSNIETHLKEFVIECDDGEFVEWYAELRDFDSHLASEIGRACSTGMMGPSFEYVCHNDKHAEEMCSIMERLIHAPFKYYHTTIGGDKISEVAMQVKNIFQSLVAANGRYLQLCKSFKENGFKVLGLIKDMD